MCIKISSAWFLLEFNYMIFIAELCKFYLFCKSVQVLAFKYPIFPYYEKLNFGKVSTVEKFEKDNTVLVT